MLRIVLDIAQIDYAGAMDHLLPPFLARCAASPSPGDLEKLVRKLDGDALPVVKRLMRYLEPDVKDALVTALLNRYRNDLAAAAHAFLDQELPPGAVRIAGPRAQDLPGPRLLLQLDWVQVDYAAVLGSPKVTGALERAIGGEEVLLGAANLLMRAAAKLPAEGLEKQAVGLLSAGKVKQKLLGVLSANLERQRFPVTFRDIQLHAIGKDRPAAPEAPAQEPIPPALADALTNALAAFLRDAARQP